MLDDEEKEEEVETGRFEELPVERRGVEEVGSSEGENRRSDSEG